MAFDAGKKIWSNWENKTTTTMREIMQKPTRNMESIEEEEEEEKDLIINF